MKIDPNLQNAIGWEVHSGPGIGGVPPDAGRFGFVQHDALIDFYTQYSGAGFADWLAAIHRPILQTPTKVRLAFDVMFSCGAGLFAQAREFDTELSLALLKYNASCQINDAEGGKLQISDVNGSWQDVPGALPGILAADAWHSFAIDYLFDTVKHVYSIVTVAIDGIPYAIPSNMQNLPALPTNWTDRMSLQVQQDLKGGGGAYSQTMQNVRYIYTP